VILFFLLQRAAIHAASELGIFDGGRFGLPKNHGRGGT
jgi:hypothetical protein